MDDIKEYERLVKWANNDDDLVFDSHSNLLLITSGILAILTVIWIIFLFIKNPKTGKKRYQGRGPSSSKSDTLELEPTGMLKNMNYEGNKTRSNIAYMSPHELPREEVPLPHETPELPKRVKAEAKADPKADKPRQRKTGADVKSQI